MDMPSDKLILAVAFGMGLAAAILWRSKGDKPTDMMSRVECQATLRELRGGWESDCQAREQTAYQSGLGECEREVKE